MASSTIHERAVRLARDQADYESREAQPNYAAEYEYILRVLRAVPEVRAALEEAAKELADADAVPFYAYGDSEGGTYVARRAGVARSAIDAALALLPAESEGDDA